MVKCKKHALFVTGCSRWNGSYLSEVCEECVLKAPICEHHGDTTGREKTLRRNNYRPIDSEGNIDKMVPTLKTRPYFEGGLNGRQV